MFGWRRNGLAKVVADAVKAALDDAESEVAARYRKVTDLQGQITELREKLETLRISKARKDEEFATREREIEHKVGLERARQEFEIEQAKREATVAIREENLEADKERFAEQMEFHRTRLEAEVASLRDLTGKLLERLPSAEIIANISGGRNGNVASE